MPAFVVSDAIEVVEAEYRGPLGGKQNLVPRLAETLLCHIILVAAGSQQRCFVPQVCQGGAYHSHRRACHGDKVHIGSQRNLTRVNFEDSKTSIPIWSIYRHAPVKAAWTQQRYVESIRRLVAPTTTTAWRVSKPSISTSNWFSVCSRSSLLLMLEPRWRPTASISSIKMMLGEAFFACSKR